MIIEVRPVERTKYHGKGVSYGAEGKFFGIKAVPDPKTLKYKTGLTSEDIKFLKKMGVPFDLSDTYTPGKAHPFWDSMQGMVRLPYRTTYINTDEIMGRIHYRLLQASEYVANSLQELEDGKYPNAVFVITNSEEADEQVSKRFALRAKLYKKTSDMSKEDKVKVLLVATGDDYSGKREASINSRLAELIEKAPKKLEAVLEMDNEFLTNRALIEKGLSQGLLTQVGTKIMFGSTLLGNSKDEAAKNLGNEENEYIYAKLVV